MKRSFLLPFAIVLTVACSGSPGPGDTYLEMQNKICEKQSLTPMMDYAAPESMVLIGFASKLAEDERKGAKVKENIAKVCKTGVKIIEEKIDGDIATLKVSNDKDAQTMRKVDGKWKLVLIKDNKKSKGDGQTKEPVLQDESPPIGVWVSGDQKIIVTKEKFDECKWLSKPPIEGTPVEGCNYYFEGSQTKAEFVKGINEFFANKSKSIKNDKEKNIEEINLSLFELKKQESETQGILNQIIDMPLKTIAGYEQEGGDCYGYFFMDSTNLYRYHDCEAVGLGISIELFRKQN